MSFITSLVLCSNAEGHPLHVVTEEGWTARPLIAHPVQSNSFDCGLWVLAAIAAVLHGNHTMGLAERDMGEFHQLLLKNVLHYTHCI